MDLPTCPTCGQSVLDDDAKECPFCGSSMSAPKTATTPTSVKRETAAQQKPQAAHPPTPELAATNRKAKSPKKERSQAADQDEDIISRDEAALKSAVPVSPKRLKGRTHEVVCPMCEAVGYVPLKAAGRDVKCFNPQCMMPIFTAPPIMQETDPEPEQKSGLPAAVYAGIAVVLVILLGGGGGYFLIQQRTPPDQSDPINGVATGVIPQISDDSQQIADGGDQQTNASDEPNHELPLAEIQTTAIKEIVDAARRVTRALRPRLRRMAAEASARVGDSAGAREHMQEILKIGEDLSYMQVTPLVVIGWEQMATGSRTDVTQTLNEALKAAGSLRKRGRYHIDAAMALATFLAANGRISDAHDLLYQHRSDEPALERYTADLFIVRHTESFDYQRTLARRPIGGWHAPQRAAVTVALVARGFSDVALKWTSESRDIISRTEATIAWAETVARQRIQADPHADLGEILKQAERLEPAGKARLLARLADIQLAVGNEAAGTTFLDSAVFSFKSVRVPPPARFSDIKSLMELKLDEAPRLQLAVRAAADLARIQFRQSDPQTAWATLSTGIQFARGIAPGVVAAQRQWDEISEIGAAAIRDRLQEALKLPSHDQARLVYGDYRKKCRQLLEAADQRFGLQVAMLEAAVQWGMADEVGEMIKRADSDNDPHAREPYFSTSLPGVLLSWYKKNGKHQKVQELQAAWGENADQVETLRDDVESLIANENVARAAGLLNEFGRRETADNEWTLLLVSRLARQGKLEPALRFIQRLDQSTLREDALWLVSAHVSQTAAITELMQIASQQNPSLTDRAALYAGVIDGIIQMSNRTPPKTTKAKAPSTGL